MGLSVFSDVEGGGGGRGGEWYLMKGRNVTVEKNHKPFFCTVVTRSTFHSYRTLMVS